MSLNFKWLVNILDYPSFAIKVLSKYDEDEIYEFFKVFGPAIAYETIAYEKCIVARTLEALTVRGNSQHSKHVTIFINRAGTTAPLYSFSLNACGGSYTYNPTPETCLVFLDEWPEITQDPDIEYEAGIAVSVGGIRAFQVVERWSLANGITRYYIDSI